MLPNSFFDADYIKIIEDFFAANYTNFRKLSQLILSKYQVPPVFAGGFFIN